MYQATAIFLIVFQIFSNHVNGAGVTVEDMRNDINQLRENTVKDVQSNIIPIRQIKERIKLYEQSIILPGLNKIDQAAAPYLKSLNETKEKAEAQKKDISGCLKGHEAMLTELPGNLKEQLKANVSAQTKLALADVLGYENQLNATLDLVNNLDIELSKCKGDADQECILKVGDKLRSDSFLISNIVMSSVGNASKAEISSLSLLIKVSNAFHVQMANEGKGHLKQITDCAGKILSGIFVNSVFYDIYSYLLN